MSLITEFEVLQYSFAGPNYPTRQFCELIPQIEEELARECLGQALYDYLVTKLRAYPENPETWSAHCTTYTKNSVVVAGGKTYLSTTNYNTTDPLEANNKWVLFTRFTTDYSNLLWTKYLRRLLALKVFLASLTPQTFEPGANGLVVKAGGYNSTERTGNQGEVNNLKDATMTEIDRVMANMLVWLKANRVTAGFPADDRANCVDGNCGPVRKRRWLVNSRPRTYR